MELVLGTHGFAGPGGSETYLLTLAEQLQRLGHGVTIFAIETGAMSEFAGSRGIRVAAGTRTLPAHCDALVVQDGAVAYRLAELYPSTPQVFRAASDLHDLQLPPNLPDMTAVVVALSERVAARIRALAIGHELVRLRQPVDTERFAAGPALPVRPRRALLLGNHLRGVRREMLIDALEARGIEWTQLGTTGTADTEPERAIWDADMVVAKGRAAIEGMACARAVYVYDQYGSDGWVTAERYAAMEADNFAGQSSSMPMDRAALGRDLDAYDADMGTFNRELATRHHGARRHAQQLGEILARLGPRAQVIDAPLRELARLVRLQWQTELRALGSESDWIAAREAHAVLTAEHVALKARYAALHAEHHRP